jgi:hypothetical protein
MIHSTKNVQIYRRELHDAMDDRNRLSRLHSEITERINGSFGEEKEMLVKFRQEVKDALNCRVPQW